MAHSSQLTFFHHVFVTSGPVQMDKKRIKRMALPDERVVKAYGIILGQHCRRLRKVHLVVPTHRVYPAILIYVVGVRQVRCRLEQSDVANVEGTPISFRGLELVQVCSEKRSRIRFLSRRIHVSVDKLSAMPCYPGFCRIELALVAPCRLVLRLTGGEGAPPRRGAPDRIMRHLALQEQIHIHAHVVFVFLQIGVVTP